MGYRSDMYIKSTIDLFPEFAALCSEHAFKPRYLSSDSDYFYTVYQSVKWYPSYPEVEAVQKFINENSDKVTAIRHGEDNYDIEEYGSDDLELYYSVNIELDNFQKNNDSATLKKQYPDLFI